MLGGLLAAAGLRRHVGQPKPVRTMKQQCRGVISSLTKVEEVMVMVEVSIRILEDLNRQDHN